MAEGIKIDARDWTRTFNRYVAVRKTARAEVIQQKARDFAFKAFQSLAPTSRERIDADMRKDNMLLKLTVKWLQGQGVNLKHLASQKVTIRGRKGGGKRTISAADKIISDYAKRILKSKRRSRGYHRVAFLLLAQKMGRGANVQVNPRSRLARTNVKETHTYNNDTYALNAIARGMDCPSTHEARDRALGIMKADMEAFIEKRLADARKQAGFR